ncbi:MAG: hypothetical protein IJT94_04770 [Oscillibacter sp.]|nr:hypothetical protein [Oscillibacter sp.]
MKRYSLSQSSIYGESYVVCTAIELIVQLNNTHEFTMVWSWVYGGLPSGQYRIGKRFLDVAEPGDDDSHTFYALFSIE